MKTVYKSKNFQIIFNQMPRKALLIHKVLNGTCNTKDLPDTINILKKYIPSVFKTECFNPTNKTFIEEARSTEVAHLLEHIILERLKQERLKEKSRADFRGWTEWDLDSSQNEYQIEINSGKNNARALNLAICDAAKILEEIYQNVHHPAVAG